LLLATEGLDAPIEFTRGELLAFLEHHVLKEVAIPRLLSCFRARLPAAHAEIQAEPTGALLLVDAHHNAPRWQGCELWGPGRSRRDSAGRASGNCVRQNLQHGRIAFCWLNQRSVTKPSPRPECITPWWMLADQSARAGAALPGISLRSLQTSKRLRQPRWRKLFKPNEFEASAGACATSHLVNSPLGAVCKSFTACFFPNPALSIYRFGAPTCRGRRPVFRRDRRFSPTGATLPADRPLPGGVAGSTRSASRASCRLGHDLLPFRASRAAR